MMVMKMTTSDETDASTYRTVKPVGWEHDEKDDDKSNSLMSFHEQIQQIQQV